MLINSYVFVTVDGVTWKRKSNDTFPFTWQRVSNVKEEMKKAENQIDVSKFIKAWKNGEYKKS